MINLNGLNIKLLGDAHLGKSFKNGVPLHRRGEREALVWEEFWQKLSDAPEEGVHVNLGDLFNQPHVSYDLIFDTALVYCRQAELKPLCHFIILKGNHDYTRDLEKKSAFDIFAALVSRHENITIITDGLVLPYGEKWLGFVAWHPLATAEEIIRTVGKCDVLFGHLDIHPLSDPHNLIPTKLLSELGVTTVYTGHDHLPRIEVRDGVTINVVGSMQPYSHSEDPDELLYVTRDLATVRANPDNYLDKCLRIELAPGEKLDFDVDCLQLTLKKAGVEEEDISVQMDEFNLDRLLEESLVDIDEGIGMLVRDKYQELRSR